MATAALHEVVGGEDAAAAAFTAVLAARRAALDGGTVLWCLPVCRLYAPGLAAFGLPPERLIVARIRREEDRLWAMEEGLKCRGLAAVIGEVRRFDLRQSRRLQLAAEGSGVTALLLRGPDAGLAASAAQTRWRVTAAPSLAPASYAGIGRARWQVELLRTRGGRTGTWLLQWNEGRDGEAGAFALVAALADGPVQAQPRAAAG